MLPFHKLFSKTLSLGNMRSFSNGILILRAAQLPGAMALAKRSYTQKATETVSRRISPMQSMREFFSHPMTWDRNNGYLNVLLCLAIFGFCFFTSCPPTEQKRSLDIPSKK
ncbi:uncharacterized protein LOC115634123 [Scaptodrosophila lebanonensis]|uniref:Uncharacterized protein LOC115634123 n=1 Tax=Drosophila lebanonensis TaxID=7225 RepID=A0A6J2UJ75_DROLE|nr:uncharacterized protein LOC115634123 [Scaptodrosophila lebanonensis]